MLSSVGNTEFVAVGKMSLDRSKLPHLRRGNSGEARKRGRKARPQGGDKQSLGKHAKPLPGIESSSPNASPTSTPRTQPRSTDPLPDISPSAETSNIMDTDELQSSSRLLKEKQPLPPVGNESSGDHVGEAQVNSLMNEADGVDRVHGSERDRQRRAHQERITTRQVHTRVSLFVGLSLPLGCAVEHHGHRAGRVYVQICNCVTCARGRRVP